MWRQSIRFKPNQKANTELSVLRLGWGAKCFLPELGFEHAALTQDMQRYAIYHVYNTHPCHLVHHVHTLKDMQYIKDVFALKQYISAVAEILCKFFLGGDFQFFVVSDQGKHTALISTIHFFTGYMENAKYPPDKNCVSCSRHKIIWKLAYLRVRKLCILFEGTKLWLCMRKPGISWK